VLVILNVTEGGVKDLLYLPFHNGAKRRSTNPNAVNLDKRYAERDRSEAEQSAVCPPVHSTNVSDQREQTQQPAPPARLPGWQIPPPVRLPGWQILRS
jgi:hypothetical protein